MCSHLIVNTECVRAMKLNASSITGTRPVCGETKQAEMSALSLPASLHLLLCLFHGPYGTEAGYVRHCVHGRDRFTYATESRCPEAL